MKKSIEKEDKELKLFLKKILGFRPKNLEFYKLAFIHKSATYTDHYGIEQNNERLEFLGDAILDAIISDILYKNFPKFNEGLLTKTRAKLVNTNQLSFYSKKLKISQKLFKKTNHHLNEKHLYADSFEAFIGALYLDRGYKKTFLFIQKIIIDKYTDLYKLINTETNHKSILIEFTQKNNISIKFDTKINENNSHEFLSEIFLDGFKISSGSGKTKKEAEQNASFKAIKKINPNYNNAESYKSS